MSKSSNNLGLVDLSWDHRHLVVKSGTTAGQHDILSALWVRLMFCQMYPHHPLCPPWCHQGWGIWWPRVVWTWVPLTWAHVILSAVFNRMSPVFKSTLQYCLDFSDVTPVGPLDALPPTPPQYRHLVVKIGTTAGQHNMWSACGPYWCLVKCTPSPTPSPVEASSSQKQYYIRSAWHLVSHWVRLTCLFEGKSGASSCCNSSSMSRY